MQANFQWKPPKSPIGMLQVEMCPDVLKILATCMLHNHTSRKLVDKVYKTLFKKYPTPEVMQNADLNDLSKILNELQKHLLT